MTDVPDSFWIGDTEPSGVPWGCCQCDDGGGVEPTISAAWKAAEDHEGTAHPEVGD